MADRESGCRFGYLHKRSDNDVNEPKDNLRTDSYLTVLRDLR